METNLTASREIFMTPEEAARVKEYLECASRLAGATAHLVREWEQIERCYRGEQTDIPGLPNTRVNILNMQTEGQVCEIADSEVTVEAVGQSPGDEAYAGWTRTVLDWTLRQNGTRRLLGDFARRLLKFGTAWLKAEFDPDGASGFGLVRFVSPSTSSVFVDTMVKTPSTLQKAAYIYEKSRLTREAALSLYGKKADFITYSGGTDMAGEGVATVYQRWSRLDGKLRVEEFSGCGLLLYDSAKAGLRDENQKHKPMTGEAYYACVGNNYPYFVCVCYPAEGRLHGFGDGKLLLRLQEALNDMYDKIRIAARPNLLLYDSNAEIELDDLDDCAFDPKPFNGDITQNPVRTVPWGSVNESWWRMIGTLHQEAQRVTRYSDIMMGFAQTSSATDAAIVQQQGGRGIAYKKAVIQESFALACRYALGLMMEFYDGKKAFRLTDADPRFEWVDFAKLRQAPVYVPPEEGFSIEYGEKTGEKPEWQLLEVGGRPVTKNAELDISISLGAGLPGNKTFLWQMVERFASLRLPDRSGELRSALSWEEIREFARSYLGLPLVPENIGEVSVSSQLGGVRESAADYEASGAVGAVSANASAQTPADVLNMSGMPL